MKTLLKTILSVFLVIGLCSSVNASPILPYNFDLKVTDEVTGSNTMGLELGDFIDVSIALDKGFDPGTDPDYTTHEPIDYAEFMLEVTIKGTTYDETDDVLYNVFPYVTANLPDWTIHRFELLTADFYLYVDEDFGMRMTSVFDSNGNTLPAQYRNPDGTWTILDSSPEAWALDGQIYGSLAPIPEPATFALFGLGILGLAGITRRRK